MRTHRAVPGAIALVLAFSSAAAPQAQPSHPDPEESQAEGSGQPLSASCRAMAQLELSDAMLVDAGGDGTWSPGEAARVRATLTNTGADNFRYPGIAVTADHPGVHVEMDANWLYGMFAGQSATLEIPVRAAESAPVGTVVELTVRIDAINLDCAWNSTSLTVTLEAAPEPTSQPTPTSDEQD